MAPPKLFGRRGPACSDGAIGHLRRSRGHPRARCGALELLRSLAGPLAPPGDGSVRGRAAPVFVREVEEDLGEGERGDKAGSTCKWLRPGPSWFK